MITLRKKDGEIFIESTCKDKQKVTLEQAETIVEILLKHIAKVTGKSKVYVTGDYMEGDK